MIKKLRTLLFSNQTLKQTILKNTFWLGISQIAGRVIRAVIVIYAARILGAAGYGVFSYAIALAGFLSIFSDIGINWILIREVSKAQKLRSRYLSTAFFIKLVLLLFLFVLIIFVAPYFTKIPGGKVLLPVIALLFLFDGLREFGFAFIRSLEKMELEAGINIFTNIAIVVISITILLYSPTPYSLAVAYTIGSGLGLVTTAWVIRTHLLNLIKSFAWPLLPKILSAIWPFAITNLLWSVLAYTDILMLGWLRNSTEVGFYSAAQRPIQLLIALPMIISVSTLPAISQLVQHNNNQLKPLLEKAFAMIMLLALPLATGGWLLGKDLTIMLYGTGYTGAIGVFQILVGALIVIFPAIFISYIVFVCDWQKEFLPPMAGGAILNVGLNLLLIPYYGPVGAAVATVISQTLAYGWIYVTVRKRLGFAILAQIYRMLVATLGMAFIIITVQNQQGSFLLSILLAVIGYFIILMALKEPLLNKVLSLLSETE